MKILSLITISLFLCIGLQSQIFPQPKLWCTFDGEQVVDQRWIATGLSLAQTPEQKKVIEEFVQKFNNGNDDVPLYTRKKGGEIKELIDSLGAISEVKLIRKEGKTFFYEVKLSYAGIAELKIVFKENLIEKFSFETSKEYQNRSYTDSLISKSLDLLRTAYMSFDIAKSFEEIEKIEKLYNSGNSSKGADFKYRIKYMRAEACAISNNNEEALRLLGELKDESPEYVKQSIYNCSFALLHSNPEFIRITGNPIELYFALAEPINDSIRQFIDTDRLDEALKYLDVKDSLYATLATDDRAKVSFMQFRDRFIKSEIYAMKGNVNEAIHLLQEMKENDEDYAIYIATMSADSVYFKNLKRIKEYETLISGMTCNCGDVFDWVVTEFEKSDAGFDYAIEMKGKDAYEKHTAEKRPQSKLITSSIDCVHLVNEWLSFFRKSHIGLFPNMPIFPDTINTYNKFAVKRLSTNTMYMKIKSFHGNKSLQIISDMIGTNDYLLSNTPNLIIDLRGNGGGNYSGNSQYLLTFSKLCYIKKRFRTTLCKMIFIFAFRGCFFAYVFLLFLFVRNGLPFLVCFSIVSFSFLVATKVQKKSRTCRDFLQENILPFGIAYAYAI